MFFNLVLVQVAIVVALAALGIVATVQARLPMPAFIFAALLFGFWFLVR